MGFSEGNLLCQATKPLGPFISATVWLKSRTDSQNVIAPNYALSMAKKVEPEQAVDAFKKGGLTPLEPFPGTRGRWKSTCNSCGATVTPFYSSVVNKGNNGCKHCARKQGQLTKRLTDVRKSMVILKRKNLTLESEYVSVKTPANIKCLDCNSVFYTTIDSFRSKRICPCKKPVSLPSHPLSETHPEIAIQWNSSLNEGITASMVSKGSRHKAWWDCSLGHVWDAAVYSRVSGKGCAVCAGRRIVSGTNDFASASPTLALEWDFAANYDVYPDQVAPYSNTNFWWNCLKEPSHRWKTSPSKRSLGRGCPFCARVKFKPGVNDLATLRPDWLIELVSSKNAGIDLGNTPVNSKDKLTWNGPCGHEWEQSPHQRGRGFGCTVCAGKKIVSGVNDLASEYPQVAKYLDLTLNEFDATKVSSHSGRKAFWFCDFGHTYESVIASRVNQKVHCPVCSLKVFQEGSNDLATSNPELLEQWHADLNLPLLPSQLTASSRRSVWWACKREHPPFMATVRSRKLYGCPYCSGWTVLPGETDLETVNPSLASEWNHELNSKKPSEVSSGSDFLAWWTDKQGHTWQQKVQVRSRGVGCPECAQGGFSSTKPGILYLIYHPTLFSRKVGITNVDIKTDRLAAFRSSGWSIEKTWTGPGASVLKMETLFFRWIRKELRIPPFLAFADMPKTGGWSETFSAEAVGLNEAAKIVNGLIAESLEDLVDSSDLHSAKSSRR